MHSILRRISVALLSVVLLMVAPAIQANATTQATTTCSIPLQPFFNGTIHNWSDPREIIQHRFGVRVPYSGFGDLTELERRGIAKIYFRSQWIDLSPWSYNIWGVSSTFVVGRMYSIMQWQNWVIKWPYGANGVKCWIA